jgi:hypothetical protein
MDYTHMVIPREKSLLASLEMKMTLLEGVVPPTLGNIN